MRALNSDWHCEHFVCGGCGRPIGDEGFVEAFDAAYHRCCHADKFATKCFYCGGPMTTGHVRDAWGSGFCRSHVNEISGCVFCGRLVDGVKIRGVATEAGLRCHVCAGTAVEKSEDGAATYAEVLGWAARHGLSVPFVPLILADRGTLSSYQGGGRKHRLLGTTRITTTMRDARVIGVEISCIAVLRGLPRVLFGAVVAHEIGHAWLRSAGIDQLDPASEEGFCELLAFTWLGEVSTPERDFHRRAIANNEDAVYGGGFRRVRALATTGGLGGLVDFLRSARCLPPG